jgi:hypothetical protein
MLSLRFLTIIQNIFQVLALEYFQYYEDPKYGYTRQILLVLESILIFVDGFWFYLAIADYAKYAEVEGKKLT